MPVAFVKRHARPLLAALVVLLCIVLIALFVRAYQDAGPSDSHAGPRGTLGTSTSGPSAVPSPGSSGFPGFAGFPTLPPYTITPAEPPGFVFARIPEHTLVVTVSASRPIPGVGYLIPTSLDHAYGKVKNPGVTHWTLTTKVIGKPYYAAVFIQADAQGTPLTCTITVDGILKDKKTTSGGHGRTVCVG